MSFSTVSHRWISLPTPSGEKKTCAVFTKDFLFKQSHSTEQQPQGFTGKMPQTGDQQASVCESMLDKKGLRMFSVKNKTKTKKLFTNVYSRLIVNFQTNSDNLNSAV